MPARGLHGTQLCGRPHCSNTERDWISEQHYWPGARATPVVDKNMEGAVYNPNSLGPSQEGVCSQSGLFGKVEDPKVRIEEIEAGELGKGALANIYMWETGSVGLSGSVDRC